MASSLASSTRSRVPTAVGTGSPNPSQTVPVSHSSNEKSQLADAESAFPLAAIICIAVVGGLIALFVVYRLYRWMYARGQRRRAASSFRLPPTPSTATDPFANPHNQTMAQAGNVYPSLSTRSSSFFGTVDSQAKFGGGAGAGMGSAANSVASISELGVLGPAAGPAATSMQPTSPFMGTASSAATSRSSTPPNAFVAHPYYPGSGARPPIRGNSSMSTDQLRAQGSRSSLFVPNTPAASAARDASRERRHSALPHSSSHGSTGSSASHATSPSVSSPSAAVTLSPFGTPRRPRVSGPPHARHSRVEIVPPMPLAPPPGTVVATDKATLNFSSLSGIGASGTLLGLSELASPQRPHAAGPSGSAALSPPAAGPGLAYSSGSDISSVGAAGWFNTPAAGSELELARNGQSAGSSPPGSSEGVASASLSGPSSRGELQGQASGRRSANSSDSSGSNDHGPSGTAGAGGYHARGFSEATSTASAHFSDESAPMPPLPAHSAISTPSAGRAQTDPPASAQPQSPLDQLRTQLEGEARRVQRISSSSTSASPSSARASAHARSNSGVLSRADVAAYRRGESGPVPGLDL